VTASDSALVAAARDVCDLFGGQGWPRIEVMVDDEHDRRILPLSDADADLVRALRRVLRGTP
jgi:hypothetical protein